MTKTKEKIKSFFERHPYIFRFILLFLGIDSFLLSFFGPLFLSIICKNFSLIALYLFSIPFMIAFLHYIEHCWQRAEF